MTGEFGELTIRPARADELAEVGALTVAAYVADEHIPADHFYTATLADTVDRADKAELYVATLGEEIVATVTFCPPGSPYREVGGDGQGEFRMLGVAPSARGRGVARALVESCFDRCAELGLGELVLCTMAEMTSARALYESMGFVRAPELDFRPEPSVALLAYRATVSEAASGSG